MSSIFRGWRLLLTCWLLVGVSLLSGCDACDNGTTEPPPVTQLYPALQVSQTALDFDQVKVGTYVFQGVTLGNQGQATLKLTEVQWDTNGREAFRYELSADTVTVGGTESVLKIYYTPSDEGTDTGVLSFKTNDPKNPVVRVTVEGQGTIPDIVVSPTELAFEGVNSATSKTLDVYLENTGTGKLTLHALTIPEEYSAYFSLELPGNYLPEYALMPDILLKLRVTYHPPEGTPEGTNTGVLRIESDDPDERLIEVPLTGTNVVPPPPQAPTVEIVAPITGAEVYVGQPMFLQGKVLDDVDAPDTLVVYFFSSLDLKLADPTVDGEGNVQLITSSLSVGDHVISLFATDSKGQTGYAQINLKVWNEETEWQYYIAGLNPDGSPNPEYRFSVDDDIQIIRVDGVTGEQTFCLNDLDALATYGIRVTCNAHLGDKILVIAYDVYADDASVGAVALYFRDEFQPIIPQALSFSTGRAIPGSCSGDVCQSSVAACPDSPYANEWKARPEYDGAPPPPCEFARAEITVTIPTAPDTSGDTTRRAN